MVDYMKNFIKIIFLTFLIFSFISCKKNKENKTFISPEPKTDNSPKNEVIDIDELIEKFDLKNQEVKEYFKPFYDALKKFDNENPTPENQIRLFYETIKVLDKEYYYNILDFNYEPSYELTEIFHKIFSEDEIWQNIISNLQTKASQQPDRFLDTGKTIKIKDISIVSIDYNECTCQVQAEAEHWFYADWGLESARNNYFKYYDDICINEKDLKRYEQKAIEEYEKIGEGKYGGNVIKTKENHIFHLIKKDGIFKIKDFVFNITSISDY